MSAASGNGTSSQPTPRVVDKVSGAVRGANKYFKYRAAIVLGWVLLVAVSVGLGLTGAERNSIGATVQVREVVGSHWVSVKNDSAEPWQDVTLTLPGDWTYQRRTLRPQDTILVEVTSFERGRADGSTEKAREFSPAAVTVATQSGTYRYTRSQD